MNDLEAIARRKSRRSYLETSIGDEKLHIIQNLIDKYNQEANLLIKLIKDGSEAFNIISSYGVIKGARTLIALIGKKDDINRKEKIGYYGELLVLEATKMNLGTCWLAGAFNRKNKILATMENEILEAVIAIGNVAEETLREKFLHNMFAGRTKALNQFYIVDCPAPEWFVKGIESVQKAPSSLNRQPVKFEYKAGEVWAFVEECNRSDLIDLGIAKAHFSIAAGGRFVLGNFGKFIATN